MVLDYECALIELDAAETTRFQADPAFQDEVGQRARDLADDTDRTVLVYGAAGQELATIAVD